MFVNVVCTFSNAISARGGNEINVTTLSLGSLVKGFGES